MAAHPIFHDGNAIIVTTEGPGKLRHFSYGSGNMQSRSGSVATTRHGVSHFVIGFSYTFPRYAFIWEGNGKATCCTSFNRQEHPVGKSWSDACLVEYGHPAINRGALHESIFHGTLPNIDDTICYLLPEKL